LANEVGGTAGGGEAEEVGEAGEVMKEGAAAGGADEGTTRLKEEA
jgi:hypothetical protein